MSRNTVDPSNHPTPLMGEGNVDLSLHTTYPAGMDEPAQTPRDAGMRDINRTSWIQIRLTATVVP